MHHRTKRLLSIVARNSLIGIGLIALMFTYAYVLNTSENLWVQLILASAPIVISFAFVVGMISKNQLESEERQQERTLRELSREWKDSNYYSDTMQSASMPIAKVFRDDI